jgi:hypothetical protein
MVLERTPEWQITLAPLHQRRGGYYPCFPRRETFFGAIWCDNYPGSAVVLKVYFGTMVKAPMTDPLYHTTESVLRETFPCESLMRYQRDKRHVHPLPDMKATQQKLLHFWNKNLPWHVKFFDGGTMLPSTVVFSLVAVDVLIYHCAWMPTDPAWSVKFYVWNNPLGKRSPTWQTRSSDETLHPNWMRKSLGMTVLNIKHVWHI